jgi:hypothetical protein
MTIGLHSTGVKSRFSLKRKPSTVGDGEGFYTYGHCDSFGEERSYGQVICRVPAIWVRVKVSGVKCKMATADKSEGQVRVKRLM